MKFKYPLLALVSLFVIASSFMIYTSFKDFNMKQSQQNNDTNISNNSDETSSSEVNNINQKQAYTTNEGSPQVTITSKSDLMKLIASNMALGKDTIAKITDSSLKNDLNNIAINTSRINGYSGYVSSLNYGIKGNNISIHFEYKNGTDYFLNHIKAVDSKTKAILSEIITPDMSDYSKELAIHNYIINNSTYDSTRLDNNTLTPDDFTAYGVLINNTAVCEGYAEAMYRLLNAAGIENHIVYGTADNVSHAWNIVKLNNNYYQVDTTFDDPVSNSNPILSYGYFNISDSQISVNHKWDTSQYPACIDDSKNYYVVNNLVADNKKSFYNIIKKQLLKKQSVIRCKTSSYNTTTFNLKILSQIINDSQKIDYVNTDDPISYQYDKNTNEMQIFINYK